ncbi:glutamic acid-rich protein-like [Episyrphus balteatus]|uniref:glutamic acid-rich protein-like n=1 Tax=Episyrphus balteatus TaxID=286459 RepID=UPI002485109F|nr:glutamic acid-rich protein-like [Episyrphus balteatus]
MDRSKSKSMENLLCEESADDLFKTPAPVTTKQDEGDSDSSVNEFDYEQYYYALTSESERSLDTFKFKIPAQPPKKPKRSDLNAPTITEPVAINTEPVHDNTQPVDKSTQTDDSDSDFDPEVVVEEEDEEVSQTNDTPPQLEWDNEDLQTDNSDSDFDPEVIVEEEDEEVPQTNDTPPQLEWDNEDLHLLEQFDIDFDPDPWRVVKRFVRTLFYALFIWLIHKLADRFFDEKY